MIIRMTAFLHVMVNYNNDSESKAFAAKCLRIKGAEKGQFVLVNNSARSQDDTAFEELQRASQQIDVLNCPDNPGYFGAAQRAWQKHSSNDFKYVILSNTDLEILNEDFYDKLLQLGAPGDVGAIAPSIWSELSQHESNPLYWQRPSSGKIRFLKHIYSSFPLAWSYHVLSAVKSRFHHPRPISEGQVAYAPHGCFIILSKAFFRKNGDFSHGVRLYGEEVLLGERLLQMGLKVFLAPDLKVLHREKGTEVSWFHRVTLSRRTFLFKKEAAIFLERLFNPN